ncbi:Lipid-binding SYLF domain-containing protein [Mucilaginibacter lappiensis]|uniref:Lipid-binding SYLF domain-containing protein n=1 Tax=Mucilaginibacter lappiensis TaxID=354630 RepID=A0ABR6PLC6_9SPHI|nr:lipid-binding SYLF domain-containing protein [Mucilaginibacter lappiensis]MBB6110530.1 lipid-binding SYLF domain-containing protein [Mucilaginibacter lappiensis]SIR40387.1 Lipid-binding SYLF domain-containing protein [Mucilaginibacter lappiensis]
MKTLKFLKFPLILSLFFVLISAKAGDKETERVHNAANVLKEFGKMKETIPHQLMEQSEGIVIIPKMINAGFGIGGKRGRGVAMVKLGNGKWSDPVFVTLTGGSFGLQIGVQSVDLILVFHHKGVLTKVENGDFTIGGDISAAAGPVGRSSSASTDYKLEAEVYSYSRSRGLFAGITINGSNLAIDKNAIASFYGDKSTSQEVFASSKSEKDGVAVLKEAVSAF